MKKCDVPHPEGTQIFRMFEGCIRCAALFDPDPRMADPPPDSISPRGLGPHTLMVRKTLNSSPVATRAPGICGCQCTSFTSFCP